MIPLQLRNTMRGLVKGELPWPLFIYGPPGCGKSSAALLLLDYAGGFYFTAQGLSEDLILSGKGQLRYPGSDRPLQQKALWLELGTTGLVVLDELAARSRASDHHYDAVKRAIDTRENKPLVGISNLGLDGIVQVYDDRIASRLAAGTIVHLKGEDLRLKR